MANLPFREMYDIIPFESPLNVTEWSFSGLQHLTECTRGRPSALAGNTTECQHSWLIAMAQT